MADEHVEEPRTAQRKMRPFSFARAQSIVVLIAGPDTFKLAVGRPAILSYIDPDVLKSVNAALADGRDTPFAKAHDGWVRCTDTSLTAKFAANIDECKTMLLKYGFKLARVHELASTEKDDAGFALYDLNLCTCGKPMALHYHDG
jgi:hypothetical protein